MFFGKMHDGLPCSPTVDGRNPAPADMVFKKNANNGMNFLSSVAGFLNDLLLFIFYC